MKDEGSFEIKDAWRVCTQPAKTHTSAHTQGNPQDLHWGRRTEEDYISC